MNRENIFGQIEGFDWDEANSRKNWKKHQVSSVECEQVFFNQPIVVTEDAAHSIREQRFYALGKTDVDRLLFVVFTIRGTLLRVISARDMSKKERNRFYEKTKDIAKI